MVHYKIIPDYGINNSDNIAIATAISSLYKSPMQRLSIKGFRVSLTPKCRVYFNIVIEHKKASFYISIPDEYESLILNKMQTVWNKADISRVEEVPIPDIEISDLCEIIQKDYNFKSVSVDKGDLYPLTNMLGITRDLEADEMIRLSYAIEAIKRRNWIAQAKDEYNSFRKGKIKDNEVSAAEEVIKALWQIAELIINIIIEFRILLFECVLGAFTVSDKEDKETINITIDSLEALKEENKRKGLTDATTYKMGAVTFNTQINIISQSPNKERREINMVSVANSFKDINGDNELIIKRLHKESQKAVFNEVTKFHQEATFIRKKTIFSDKEIAKFIQLPQKSLQQEYNIENIDTREVNVPEELTDGGITIGTAELKGKDLYTNWCNNYNVRALPKIVGGPQGAGKSEYTVNFIVDSNKIGDGSIVFDYIKNCELTKSAIKHIKDHVIIDLSDQSQLFAFAYPEVSNKITDDSTAWDRKLIGSEVAQQVKYLVNSLTDGDNQGPLSQQMSRYLIAAAKIVFIHPNEIVDNVFKVLEDWQTRNEYIRKSKDIYEYDDRVLNTLRELNDTDDKGKIIGTRTHLILGIANRISLLMENPRLEMMLQAPIDKHNFTDYMNKGKSVFIMMPQKDFKDPVTKDVIVTYFMTRIRLASLERSEIDKPRMCHIITDEVKQIPTAASFLEKHITEFRKFGIAPYFTVHYFKQFRTLLDAIKSAGASYMLLAGIEEENLQVLSKLIHPFTVEEGLSLKPFHSLNVINYGNQYARFISLLPKPLGGC